MAILPSGPRRYVQVLAERECGFNGDVSTAPTIIVVTQIKLKS